MYGKINKFLQKGPFWKLTKILPYWIERVLLREPDDDYGHFQETQWLLNLINRALRDSEV
jgi:nucleolar pre-ribosomal-associated protein 1